MNQATEQTGERDGEAPFPIVGAGPAGLAAAIVLARAGRRVVVHDRRKHPGGRFHNDFQGLENWSTETDIVEELAAAGINTTFDHIPVRTGVAFDFRGRQYDIRSKAPLYYLVRRSDEPGSLDRSLCDQARGLGVEVRFDSKVDSIAGPAILSIGPRRADAIAVGFVFETDMADGNWIAFDDRLAPNGYAYLLITGGHGTVASCMFSGFRDQQQYVKRTVAFFETRVGLRMKDKKPFGGYGNFRLPDSAVQGGKLVIGEQAGFQDSLAGFGIVHALRSGILAARSLLEKNDYTALWKQQLLPFLKTSISNRYIFNLAGDRGRRWALAHRLAGGDTRDALYRLYHPWWLSRIVFPLARWRFRAPLRDPSCDHQDCHCVWCEHGLTGHRDGGTFGVP